MAERELAQQLKARFGDLVSEPVEFRGEWTVRLSDAQRIAEVCEYAKKELGFDYLTDVSSIDNYGTDPRFTVVYHLYGYGHHCRLRVKTDVGEEESELPTVTGVWKTADWHEREVFDMMGIRFRGHPDLRRILMWDGYPYFPLRKDFPLSGKPSDVPEVAFTEKAPMEGGPFVTIAAEAGSTAREPRVRLPETEDVELNARLERRTDIKEMQGRSYGPGAVSKEGK
jgi:NADH-quinone oxidoreductase subunit C